MQVVISMGLPTRRGKPYCQTISIIWLLAPLRRCELALQVECWTNAVLSLYRSISVVPVGALTCLIDYTHDRMSCKLLTDHCGVLKYSYLSLYKLRKSPLSDIVCCRTISTECFLLLGFPCHIDTSSELSFRLNLNGLVVEYSPVTQVFSVQISDALHFF